jgi:hypothetical protein
VLLSVLFWAQYPSGNGGLIFGANTILYAGVLAYWIKKRKTHHLRASVVERDSDDAIRRKNTTNR